MKMKLSVFFIVLLFLFGCISQEKQFEYKNQCLSLTSYSFQGIPKCSSQEDCFNEVEKQLFDFPQDFSFDSTDKLNSYKNNLASSWLYFNKSLVLVKEINQLCQNNNFSVLPKKTNELAFSLEKAFDFTDKANLDSFSFLLLEKDFLDKEEIELIPEENLFDDFILLNLNLNELSTPEINKNSGSYVSRYFTASKKFNEFSSKIGFYSLYLNEFTSTDLIGFYQKDALNLIKSNKFYVPLLKKTFSSVLGFLFDFDDLERSMKILGSMPSNELFFLFGDFSSPKNSVASEFSLLVSKISENKINLAEKNKKLSAEIESNISSISAELDELAFSSLTNFDSNALGFLFEELESNTISQKENSIYEVEDFVFESKEKLFSESAELKSLNEKDYFNEISLGEKTSLLKEINSSILSLGEDVDFYSNDLFDELIILCDSKLELIKDDLTKTDFSEKPWEINSIASKIAVKTSSFEQVSKEEKLLYCKEVISLNKTLSLALQDETKFFLESEKSLDSCFDSLERIFYSKNLGVFVDSFYSLKSLKELNLPDSYVSDSCLDLKERIIQYLYSNDKEIIEVNSLFFDSKEFLLKLSVLSKLYSDYFSSKKIIDFTEEFNKISLHFVSDKLSFDFLENSSDELAELKKLNSELNSFFIPSLENFLSGNYSVKSIASEQKTQGNNLLVKQKLFFPNPLDQEINSLLSFVSLLIPEETSFIDSCVKEIVQEGNNSRILVSCLPKNGLFIEFDVIQPISEETFFDLTDSEEEAADLNNFNEVIQDLNSSSAEFEKEISAKKQFLEEKQFVLKDKIVLIQNLFSELDNALAESEFYLPPITQKRLSQLKQSFDSVKFSFDLNSDSFDKLLSTEQKMDASEKNLTEIENELTIALNKLKEDAKVFLLSAKLSNKDTAESQELFNQGKFIDSINSSFNLQKENSAGFFSLPVIDLPLQVYPLFGVIFFIVFKKFFYKKKIKRKRKKKIESNSV